jgi:hypothetical protein
MCRCSGMLDFKKSHVDVPLDERDCAMIAAPAGRLFFLNTLRQPDSRYFLFFISATTFGRASRVSDNANAIQFSAD